MKLVDDYVQSVLSQLPSHLPHRLQIARELQSHIAERVGGGTSVPEVLRQLGSPQTLAESYAGAVPLRSARVARRVLAKLIDFALVLAVMSPAMVLAANYGSENTFVVTLIVTAIAATFGFGMYSVVAEAWKGQTLGKRVMGIFVVRERGTTINFGQALLRNLPMFLEIFWIDALFALFTERRQRAFELLSKTRVIDVRSEVKASAAPRNAAGLQAMA